MADNTKIEWSDATWNPITGCSVVSPGCTNCYAMRIAGGRLKHHPSRAGLTADTKAGPVWTGEVRFNEKWLTQPLTWKKPRRIFVCAHGDLFHEDVPDEWIDKIFAVMALAPQHIFQVLTKRAKRMRLYFSGIPEMPNEPATRDAMIEGAAQNLWCDRNKDGGDPSLWLAVHMPLPHVWLGVSCEDQQRADERIPELLETPAAIRWISAEPLLGPIDLTRIPSPVVTPDDEGYYHSALERSDIHYRDHAPDYDGRVLTDSTDGPLMERIDWVVAGGESGPNARPMHPDWARSLRDQCAEANVPYFHKQNGSWSMVYDRDRDDPHWRMCDSIACQTQKGRWINIAGGHGFHGDRVCRIVPADKKASGRLLDGAEHNAMPPHG